MGSRHYFAITSALPRHYFQYLASISPVSHTLRCAGRMLLRQQCENSEIITRCTRDNAIVASISPLFRHNYIASISALSPVFRHYLQYLSMSILSPGSRQYFASISPLPRHYLGIISSISPVSRECLMC